MKRHIAAFASGLLFAVGLGVAGMTQPHRVVGFLDFAGDWDPTLLLVIGAAVVTYMVAFRWVTGRRRRPLFEAAFQVPTRRDIDGRLIAGAAIFGAGWGLAGLCPGPAVLSLTTHTVPAATFVASMFGGMLLFSGWEALRRRTSVGARPAVEARAAR